MAAACLRSGARSRLRPHLPDGAADEAQPVADQATSGVRGPRSHGDLNDQQRQSQNL